MSVGWSSRSSKKGSVDFHGSSEVAEADVCDLHGSLYVGASGVYYAFSGVTKGSGRTLDIMTSKRFDDMMSTCERR